MNEKQHHYLKSRKKPNNKPVIDKKNQIVFQASKNTGVDTW